MIVSCPPAQCTLDLFTYFVQSEPFSSMLNVKDAQVQLLTGSISNRHHSRILQVLLPP